METIFTSFVFLRESPQNLIKLDSRVHTLKYKDIHLEHSSYKMIQ